MERCADNNESVSKFLKDELILILRGRDVNGKISRFIGTPRFSATAGADR
jgi:hypothetical protein